MGWKSHQNNSRYDSAPPPVERRPAGRPRRSRVTRYQLATMTGRQRAELTSMIRNRAGLSYVYRAPTDDTRIVVRTEPSVRAESRLVGAYGAGFKLSMLLEDLA